MIVSIPDLSTLTYFAYPYQLDKPICKIRGVGGIFIQHSVSLQWRPLSFCGVWSRKSDKMRDMQGILSLFRTSLIDLIIQEHDC